MAADSETVAGCGSAAGYESGPDDLHVLSLDDQSSIEDCTISHDCEHVASGCSSAAELSESSDNSEHLTTLDYSDSDFFFLQFLLKCSRYMKIAMG